MGVVSAVIDQGHADGVHLPGAGDGRMDVWVTQVGTGQFYNLTRDAARELANPSVRTLGFSPDGTLVTFWARSAAGASPSDINI